MSQLPPHVLVIDDDPSVLEMVKDALGHYGMVVHAFMEGRPALSRLQDPEAPPYDLVLSDINMEGLDGFEVILRVKQCRPHLPVMLMTGQASLDYAIRALRMGASNLFIKPLAIKDLVKSVFHLVELHRDFRSAQSGLAGLVSEHRHFRFRSAELEVASLVKHLTDRLIPMGFASESNLDVIAMAYHEALVNALEHGNLELDSDLKGDLFALEDPYAALRAERLRDPKFAERAVDVQVFMSPDRYELQISDEGPGFDTSKLGSPSESDLARQCGRGLPLIQMVMDEVRFNEKGNQIRLVLNRK